MHPKYLPKLNLYLINLKYLSDLMFLKHLKYLKYHLNLINLIYHLILKCH